MSDVGSAWGLDRLVRIQYVGYMQAIFTGDFGISMCGPRGKVIAVGTGRALLACVEALAPMDCPQHPIVA